MMSAANSTLKEECGNRERFERVACRSFDRLSVTLERGEARVCVFSCAGWVGVGLGPGDSASQAPVRETWSSAARYQQRILKRLYENK